MTAWSRRSRYALAFTGAISLSLSAAASCHHPKCSADVDQATSATIPVIVQYDQDPSNAEVKAINTIGPVYHHSHAVNTLGAVIPVGQLTALAGRPGVKYISLDRSLAARQSNSRQSDVAPIGSTPEFTAEPINAPWAWAKSFDGEGIGVAIIDSGITPSADFTVNPTSTTPLPGAPTSDVQAQIAALASAIVPGGPVVSAQTGPAKAKPTPANTKPGAATNAQADSSGKSRIVYSYNFTSDDPTDTLDAYGHGTHVAGLIAGNGSNSTGSAYSRTFKGIAPNANLINLRVLDANGQGNDSSVIAAIEAAIKLQKTYNIRIINLSLGRPIYESFAQDPLCQAVEQAWNAGIVVVVAAGNDGRNQSLNAEAYGTIEAPGNDPSVITIGAANTSNTAFLGDDVMATYSSKGPSFIDQVVKPDLIAPGNLVTSVLAPSSNLQADNPVFYTPQNWYITGGSANPSTTYFPLSGTSMATAVASGAVADLMEAASYLTPDQVKVLLMSSANKGVIPSLNVITDPVTGDLYTAHNDAFTQGAGYLDLEATINNVWSHAWAIPAKSAALSPTASYDPTTGNVTVTPAKNTIWTALAPAGATVIWNAASIYGPNAFVTQGSTVLWGKTALAGASDPQGFTALWGSGTTSAATALWATGSADAATVLWGKDTTAASNSNSGSTVLWGKNSTNGSTVLWGKNSTSGSTVLWGKDSTSGSTVLWGKQSGDALSSAFTF